MAKRLSRIERDIERLKEKISEYQQQLKELEMHGMVEKKIFTVLPPHTEYSITEAGRTLVPIIEQLEAWGDDFRPKMKEILGME